MTQAPTGLPFRPGQVIQEQTAGGLVGKEAITEIPAIPADQVQAALRKEIEDGLPRMVKAVEAAREAAKAVDPKTELPGDEQPSPMPVKEERCQRCGHYLSLPMPPMPTVEDRRDFVRALMTGARFKKTYPLFGNMLRATFRWKNVAESDDVVQQVNATIRKLTGDPAIANVEMTRLNMIVCLDRLEWIDPETGQTTSAVDYPLVNATTYPMTKPDVEEPTAVGRADKALFATGADPLYNALFRAFMQFQILVDILTARSQDPDFYRPTQSAT